MDDAFLCSEEILSDTSSSATAPAVVLSWSFLDATVNFENAFKSGDGGREDYVISPIDMSRTIDIGMKKEFVQVSQGILIDDDDGMGNKTHRGS